jgi:hypothetical protein
VIEIHLNHGKSAFVDDVDSDLSRYKWFSLSANHDPTYCRAVRKSSTTRKSKTVYMHRVILSRSIGRDLLFSDQVDHINHNALDNRRSNLRLARRSDNSRNQKKCRKSTSSRYKGVYFDRFSGRWKSQIQSSCTRSHIGRYDTEIDAALAYDKKATELFGEFACLNFPC